MTTTLRSNKQSWSGHLALSCTALCVLVWSVFVAAATAADNGTVPPSAEGDSSRVILKLAGVEVLSTTIIPRLAEKYLESYGAAGIKIGDAAPPWTFKVSGRMFGGEEVSILVRSSSTKDGLDRLTKGDVDIALTNRLATSPEIAAFPSLAKTGDLASFSPIARAAIVVAVNPVNPVAKLTSDQLQGIYAGRIKDWADLGGTAGAIRAYSATNEPATAELFQNLVIGGPQSGSTSRPVASFEELNRTLRDDPGGIGYLAVPTGVRPLTITVGDDRIISPPNSYQLASGDYPLTETLYLYRNPDSSNPSVNLFFRLALSVPAQFTITSAGLSYLGPQLILPVTPTIAPASYLDLTNRGLRVSTTIRFADASVAVGKVASHDLDLLAYYLRMLRVRPDHMVLAGFSDDSGDPDKDLAVSEQLVGIVASELKQRLVTAGNVIGLGSAVQLANNRTPAGRGINRRVEIWLRP